MIQNVTKAFRPRDFRRGFRLLESHAMEAEIFERRD